MIRRYLSLVKFSHTIFAMPFALIGFFLAVGRDGYPLRWSLFLLVLGCMVFARSAAMSFNRVLDLSFDRQNPRTAGREIPSGQISYRNGILFSSLNALLFLACAFFINRLCFLLAPLALFIILGYSYTKRFTALCHIFLGLGLSLAPLGAYLAVTGSFSWLPVLFSLLVLTWVAGFDIIYSLQDETFDRSLGLHSLPARWGRGRALRFSALLHAGSVLLILAAGLAGGFDAWYWVGALLFTGLLGYQHWLVKPDDLSRVNLAFMTTNGVGSLVFALFVILGFFRH